jgi:hypothetical protein
MPSARGLGAARDLLLSFFRGVSREVREEIVRGDGGKEMGVGGLKGIEAPVSDALLAAFPKVSNLIEGTFNTTLPHIRASCMSLVVNI